MNNSLAVTQAPFPAAVNSLDQQEATRLVHHLLDHGSPAAAGEDDREAVVACVEVEGITYAVVRLAYEQSVNGVSLSPREKEIVRLVAKGLPNKTVASVLDVSTWTVATHLRRVFAKMNVSTRTEMVAYALTRGLIEAPRS